MSMLALSALPAWSQQDIILPDGTYDPQRYNDCGETCIAAIVSCVHGTPVSPGAVRANLGGPSRSGITDGEALADALRYYNVAALAATPTKNELQGYLQFYSTKRMPTIVLGTWPTPGNALHWMLTTATVDRWSYINPWLGSRSYLAWDSVQALYAGQVVVALANLHYDMSAHALPY